MFGLLVVACLKAMEKVDNFHFLLFTCQTVSLEKTNNNKQQQQQNENMPMFCVIPLNHLNLLCFSLVSESEQSALFQTFDRECGHFVPGSMCQ